MIDIDNHGHNYADPDDLSGCRGILLAIIVISGILILSLLLACSKPHCQYQEDSSCEIYTDGDRNYITIMARGQHLCCWYTTFSECQYWTEDKIEETIIEWYGELVNENPECLLEEENCGPSWSYGNVKD